MSEIELAFIALRDLSTAAMTSSRCVKAMLCGPPAIGTSLQSAISPMSLSLASSALEFLRITTEMTSLSLALCST
jgi:hypothetical protein